MTKLMTTLTISTIASIMIIGGLIASPNAYSDKKHDNVPDECKCEKPHTLKVLFTVPNTELPVPENVSFKTEIFKKLDDKNSEENQLGPTISLTPNNPLEHSMVQASQWGKDKLESNTAFVIYKFVDLPDGTTTKELVAEMEIHTSCSKPLFIGMTVFDVNDPNNGYSLEVDDGLAGMNPVMTSIPIADSLTCEDKKSKSTGSITVKKALTNDNGGTASVGDFTITVTNVETTDPFVLVQDMMIPSISTRDVQAGTYTLSETLTDPSKGDYTTILIAGDTGCPSMLNEEFTIKKGKNLSCTIYSDDDFTNVNALQAAADAAQAAADAAQAADQEAVDAQAAADAAQTAADAVIPSEPDLDQEAVDAQAAADAAQLDADSTDAFELQIIADDAQAAADSKTGSNEEESPTVKITVQVNNLEGVTPDQFEYTIGTETMKKDGDIITIPINVPTMFNQTKFIDNSDPNNPAVLPSSIEGDGNCPDVIGTNGSEVGLLTLSANQNIECVIVYGKAVEPGVVFHFDSLRFDSDTIFLPPTMPPGPDDLDKCDATESILPCIVYNAVTDRLNVIPNITTEQFRVTTLVQLNIIAIAENNAMIDLNGQAICELEGIGTSPQGKPAFVFDCQNLMSEKNQFRVNYALIETLQLGKTLT